MSVAMDEEARPRSSARRRRLWRRARRAERKRSGDDIARAKSAAARRGRGRGRRDSRALWRRSAAARFASNSRAAMRHALRSRLARFFSSAASASLRRGMARPAMPASRSTASGKLRPSVSIRKAKMSPCLPDEKSWKKPFWSLTKNEGVFSEVNGESAAPFAPGLAQFDPRAHHLRDRQPGADLVEKGGRKLHGRQIGLGVRLWQGGARVVPGFCGGERCSRRVDDPGRRDRRSRLQGAARRGVVRGLKSSGQTVAHDRLHVTIRRLSWPRHRTPSPRA